MPLELFPYSSAGTVGIVRRPLEVLGFFRRVPSLRGHQAAKRIGRTRQFEAHQVLERRTSEIKQLLVARASRASVIDLYNRLLVSGLEFQALRLRDGRVGFLLQNGIEAQNLVTKTLERSQSWKASDASGIRTLAMRLSTAAAVVALGFSVVPIISNAFATKNAETPSQTPISASIPTEKVVSSTTCEEQMPEAPRLVESFLEEIKSPSKLLIERTATTKLGGLQSVDVRVSCGESAQVGQPAAIFQRWRATLSLTGKTWSVKKMTRLEN